MAEVRWSDAALELAPGIVWAFDRALKITAFNGGARAAARRAFGRDPEPGMSLLEFINAGHRAGFEANAARCLAGEEIVLERSFVGASGPASFELSYQPIRDPAGAVVGGVLTTLDMSARLRLEQRIDHVARLETATLLAGGLAHDLRNILAVVQLELDMLAASVAAEEPSLVAIREAADRGVELTRRLMQFAGREPGARRRVDLRAAIEGALGMLRSAAGRRATLVVELAEALAVEVDVLQLERVLVNLVINACDALAEPRPVVIRTYEMRGGELGWTGLEGGRRYAIIAVRDAGEGMTEAVRARLFEPFFTTKAPGHGTGLGLASSWGIVRQHGGSMRVESSPGAGTTMMIALPLAP